MARNRCAHVLEEVEAPLEMVEYYGAFVDDEHSFFLDSGKDAEKLGRYSFIGRRPFAIFKSKRDRFEVHREGGITHGTGDPLDALREMMSEFRVDPSVYPESGLPFLGGAVGYFGYELGYSIESCLPDEGDDDLALPDSYFLLVDVLLIRDQLEGRSWISALGFDPDRATAQQKARKALEGMRADLRHREVSGKQPPRRAGGKEGGELEIRAHFAKKPYMDLVERAKERIFAGDSYQICTTHRLECDFPADPFELYRQLRNIDPAPFASYLNLPEVKIVSASPERYLRLDRERTVESRPIKGTRPRGETDARDEELTQELASSSKDRAENLMIVDLVRNDLGRVCEINSIEVPELMIVERYATVFQLVSTIVGKLATGQDVFDLVRASFPGGSMTGAPKIEAMKLIDALEPVKRGIYSGSIGYLDYAGHADLNIVIRTVLIKDGKAYFQVGGAIVADSNPEDEYLETLDKARALVRALRMSLLGSRDVERPLELQALASLAPFVPR